MEKSNELNLIQKWNPEDVTLFVALLCCFGLIGLGHNSFLGSVITTIVGYLVGRKSKGPNEQQRDIEN